MGRLVSLIFLAALFSSQLSYSDEFLGKKDVEVSTAFVPAGYDSNDSVVVVISGKFPNSCFQAGPLYSQVSRSEMKIFIRQEAYEYKGECKFKAHFNRELFLGRLREPGTYTLVDETTEKALGKLVIDEASEGGTGTDAKDYAPFFDAYLKKTDKGLVLSANGIFDKCMKLEDVEFRPAKNVLVVLPNVVPTKKSDCKKSEWVFEKDIPVTKPVPRGTYLLHVRTMGGQAINKVIP